MVSRRKVDAASNSVDVRRIDDGRDLRRLGFYAFGLVAVYTVFVVGAWVTGFSETWLLVVMAAPTVGALLARFAGPGVIVWGRPSWWILLGLMPAVICLLLGSIFSAKLPGTETSTGAVIAASMLAYGML